MKKSIKKMYNGNVEVRDYEVDQCIKNNENMVINYQSIIMTLTPEELVSKRVSKSNKAFKSSYNNKEYHLYGYKMVPDEMEF